MAMSMAFQNKSQGQVWRKGTREQGDVAQSSQGKFMEQLALCGDHER